MFAGEPLQIGRMPLNELQLVKKDAEPVALWAKIVSAPSLPSHHIASSEKMFLFIEFPSEIVKK